MALGAHTKVPQKGSGRATEHHFFVFKRLSRTHNDLRTPQRLGAALVESTGWGFQAKIGLWGGFEGPLFWGSASRCSCVWRMVQCTVSCDGSSWEEELFFLEGKQKGRCRSDDVKRRGRHFLEALSRQSTQKKYCSPNPQKFTG